MPFPDNIHEPIPDEEFKDPLSRTVKAVFYLYSEESYLYGRLNWAARSKQEQCVKNLGCFAAVLSKALALANRFREYQINKEITQTFTVYRGLSLSQEQLDFYQVGDTINLTGYASTSKQEEQSLKFAFREGMDPSRRSVMFYIDLTDGTVSGYCFQMNKPYYTRFPEEDEILLDDGRPFIID